MGANTSSWIELRQDHLSYSLNFICSLEVWCSPFRETGVDLVKKKSIGQSWESGIKIRKWLWEFSYSLKRLPDDNPSDVIRNVSFPCLFNFVTNWCSDRLPLSTDDFICGSQNPHEIPRPPGVTHLVPVPTTPWQPHCWWLLSPRSSSFHTQGHTPASSQVWKVQRQQPRLQLHHRILVSH